MAPRKKTIDSEKFIEGELYLPIKNGAGRGTSMYHIENSVLSHNGIPDLRILSGGFTFDVELKVARFKKGRGGEIYADFRHWRESQKRYVREVSVLGDSSSCWMMVVCSGEEKGVYLLDCFSQKRLWESMDKNRLTLGDLERNAFKSSVRDGFITDRKFSLSMGKAIRDIVKMKKERSEAPF